MLDGHDAALEVSRRAGLVQNSARRDPTAATRRLQYQTPGAPMVPQWDADTAIQWGYYANVIAYRCIDLRARVVASLPFRAGPAVPDRPGEVGEHNPAARLAQLLGPPPKGPAKRLTARRLWDWTMRQYLVTGRWGWEVETTGPSGKGDIAALWPLVSGSLRAIPTQSGADWWQGFRYGPYAEERRLTPEQVIYGWHPQMSDFRQPESPFQAARLDTSIAVMGDRYSYAFLKGGGVPSHIVTTAPFATDEQRQAFQGQWRAKYQGPDNAGVVHFNEAGDDGDGPVGEAISVISVGTSQRDSQFLEQHKASLEHVAMAFGVPWSLLDASGRTFDNAGQEWLTFWTLTGLDDLRDLGDDINMQLAPRLGGEVGWFDTSGIRVLQQKPEPLSAKVGAPALLTSRIYKINEARGDYGLPPLPDGDRFLTDAELAVLSMGSSAPGESAAVARSAPGDERRDSAPPAAATPEPPVDEVTVRQAETRRAVLHSVHDNILRGFEEAVERRFRRLFQKQAKATLSRLEGNRGRAAVRDPAPRIDPSAIYDRRHWKAETEDVAADLLAEIVRGGRNKIVSKFGVGVAFDLDSPLAHDLIEGRANQLAGQVAESIHEDIARALSQGAAEGEGIPELAARVQHVFDVASDTRAVRIARTEVNSAYNGAAQATAASYGEDVVGGQEWISTVDGRTRAEHAGADGQIVPIGVPFDVGGEELAYPGDPGGSTGNVVNCRCTVAFLTPEEMGERAKRFGSSRAAIAVMRLVRSGEDFDEHSFRRTLEVVA